MCVCVRPCPFPLTGLLLGLCLTSTNYSQGPPPAHHSKGLRPLITARGLCPLITPRGLRTLLTTRGASAHPSLRGPLPAHHYEGPPLTRYYQGGPTPTRYYQGWPPPTPYYQRPPPTPYYRGPPPLLPTRGFQPAPYYKGPPPTPYYKGGGWGLRPLLPTWGLCLLLSTRAPHPPAHSLLPGGLFPLITTGRGGLRPLIVARGIHPLTKGGLYLLNTAHSSL